MKRREYNKLNIKKVGCLYRVSTLKQVEKNDIPMQRISCENFIKSQPNWKLTKECLIELEEKKKKPLLLLNG